MSNKKSIVEEALLEAKAIENAVKQNSKGLLTATMQKDIDKMVKESLTENEDELEADDTELEDVSQDTPEDDSNANDSADAADSGSDNPEELSMDITGDENPEGDEDDTSELDITGDPEGGEDTPDDSDDEDTVDMTGASDDELISVFKKMDDDDEIEVVKDGENGINIKDKKTGAEYMVKMNESIDDEVTDKSKAKFKITASDESACNECSDGGDEEPLYEITFEDDEPESEFSEEDPNPEELDPDPLASLMSDDDDDDDYHDYDSYHANFDESTRRTQADKRLNNLKPENHPSKMNENIQKEYKKVIKEYQELKGKHSQTKDALKIFRDKLNEVALYNTNITHIAKLFMEHATTKSEKVKIFKQFDETAKTLKESKRLYKTISDELKDRKPINEKVNEKVNETITKASSETLVESKVYQDPQILKIQELMEKMERKK
jgi:hypothetical protein